jgi:hypothetical protein
MPAKTKSSATFQVKITLIGIEPPIWRRLQVPSSIRLCCLHSAFQVALGWTDSHLHQFEKDGKCWGVPEYDEFEELDLIDEDKTELNEVLTAAGESMTYVYDFGDNWRHEVVLEEITSVAEPIKKPVCTGGARRCPPEDVGGASGYEEFLEVIFDPTHEEFEHLVGWAGGSVHAEEFDVKAVNAALGKMRWPVRHRR